MRMLLYNAYIYISRSAAAACLTMTTTASHSSNYMYMLYSSSVYSRAYAYAHYAALYARICVIVYCETRYFTPCVRAAARGTPLPLTSLSCTCRAVCGDAPSVPSEQREYYRRRRRTSSFTSQILLRKAAACLCVRVVSYTILNRLCSKARAIVKRSVLNNGAMKK
jgi:hypothetical protein